MNSQELTTRFEEITKDMVAVMKKKNADYSGDTNEPFKNFSMVETMGFASGEQGFLTRMVDKVMRISGFVRNGVLLVLDETIIDTIRDLATYCILFIIYLEDKKGKTEWEQIIEVDKYDSSGVV